MSQGRDEFCDQTPYTVPASPPPTGFTLIYALIPALLTLDWLASETSGLETPGGNRILVKNIIAQQIIRKRGILRKYEYMPLLRIIFWAIIFLTRTSGLILLALSVFRIPIIPEERQYFWSFSPPKHLLYNTLHRYRVLKGILTFV